MRIDYDLLDDTYDCLPSRGRIQTSQKPQGSLTDNARRIGPQRNGAYKRVRELKLYPLTDVE
jgi:hypothetical protein